MLILVLVTLLLTHVAAQPAAPLQYANKTYKTAKIGTQTWFAENLNYEAEGSVCYENNPANCAKYGHLYNQETAMKVCPEGWHLPNNDEWKKLYRFIDDYKDYENPYRSRSTVGKHLKAVSGWNEDEDGENGNGIDDYGFSALPGGYGLSDGSFVNVGIYGGWWSASESGNNDGRNYLHLLLSSSNLIWNDYEKSSLFSVRCIKD